MAEQLDNQATNKSPWNFSTGNADPENPKAYRRESRGKANLNGGLMAVVGDMFDQFLELLSKLFGSLFDKNPEDVEYQKHSMETLNNDLARSIKHFGERPANLTQFSINDMNKIPEYGDKDIAKEYMNFTFYGTAWILQKDKGGQAAPILMDNTENNFRKAFSVSLSQIKEIESNGKSELNATTPTIIWMMSPVYTSAFDKIVDKNSLIAGLSEKDKKLLKEAKRMDSAERKEFFKDKSELEEAFKKVQHTALAISGADIMGKTQATEGGINSLAYSDFRISASGQLGSLQLTMDTYFEKVRNMFSKEDRLNEGNHLMQELGFSGSNLTHGQVRAFVTKVLGNSDFGGEKDVNGPGFLSSLESKIADCKSQQELAEVLGSFSLGYKSEENYLAVQQSIMNDKLNFMVKALGGKDEVNNIIKKGDSIELGDMALRGANAISFNNGKTFTAMELYDLIRKDQGQAAKSEQDAKYLLGELYKQDSKVLFLTIAHLAYHGNKNQAEVAKTLSNVNLGGKSVLKANEFNKELEGNGLVPVTNNDYSNVSKLRLEQRVIDYDELVGIKEREGKLNQLHLDPAFKDFDPTIANSTKDILARLEKANIPLELKEVEAFKDYINLLKESPDKKLIGSPVEHLKFLSAYDSKDQQNKEYDRKHEFSSLDLGVLELRLEIGKHVNGSISNIKTNKDFIDYMESDTARDAYLKDAIRKSPALKEVINEIKKEDSSLGNSQFMSFSQITEIAEKNKEKIEKGQNIDEAIKETIKNDLNTALDKEQQIKTKTFDNIYSKTEKENLSTEYFADAILDGSMTKNKKDFIELWISDDSRDHRLFFSNDKNVELALKLYLMDDYMGMPLNKDELEKNLVNYLKNAGIIFTEHEAQSLLSELKESIKKHKIDVFSNSVGANSVFEDVIEKRYGGKTIDSKLAGFLISSGILSKTNFSESWLSKNVELFGDLDEMKSIIVAMPDGEKMTFIQFGQQSENGKFPKAEAAKMAYEKIYKETMLADNSVKGLDTEILKKMEQSTNQDIPSTNNAPKVGSSSDFNR